MDGSLIGRGAVLDTVVGSLGDDRVAGILIVGSRGSGRTRLVGEIAELVGSGRRILRPAGSLATRDVPFAAFVDLLPARHLGAVEETVAGIVRLIRSGPQPPVLLCDDVHLLDGPSLATVGAVILHRAARVVLTAPTGKVPPAVEEFVAAGHLDRAVLAPLAPRDVAGMLGVSRAGAIASPPAGPSGERAVDLVMELTQGNPALVAAWRDDVAAAGLADTLDELPDTVGPRFVTAVRRHLDGLAPEEREALTLLAVGGALPISAAASLVPMDRLEALEQAGHLTVQPGKNGTVVAVTPPGHAAALRAGLPTLALRRLRGEVAETLRDVGASEPGDAARLVDWLVAAGRRVDREALLRGASDALARGDLPAAERLARWAHERAPGPDSAHLLGDALSLAGNADEADEILASASLDGAPADLRRRLHRTRARNLAYGFGAPADAIRVLRRAERETSDPRQRAELIADRALYAAMSLNTAGVLSATDALIGPHMPAQARLTGLLHRTLVDALRGAFDELERRLPETQRLVGRIGHDAPFAEHRLQTTQSMYNVGRGEIDEALEQCRQALASARSGPGPFDELLAAGNLAYVLHHAGDLDAACAILRSAEKVSADPFGMGPIQPGYVARVESERGNLAAAQKVLALEAGAPPGPRARVWFGWARGAIALQQGDADAGARILRDVAGETAAVDHLCWAAEVLHVGVRMGVADQVAEDLEAIVRRTTGAGYLELMLDHAHALVQRDPDALRATAVRLGAAGARLAAAEAACQAGALFAARGDDAGALRASVLAADLRRTLRGADTPALRLGFPSLTSRELEIAVLAPGTPSRAIADRLHITTRTVDNHLRAVYRKLGVSGRGDLATLLAPDSRGADGP